MKAALITMALIASIGAHADTGSTPPRTLNADRVKPLCEAYANGSPEAQRQYAALQAGFDMATVCKLVASEITIVPVKKPDLPLTIYAPGSATELDECFAQLRDRADVDASKQGFIVVSIDQGEFTSGEPDGVKCKGRFLLLKDGQTTFSQMFNSQALTTPTRQRTLQP